ncbi:MAG: hypothetical protein GVY18_15175 [Bacteroidetes bacterium]|jgi:hypothetical protein|nr:hypothetical protein [Bacteroidota bacterium]
MDQKKTFDAVKMVREVRDRHHEALKDKSWQERVAFYEEEARAFRKEREQQSEQHNQTV